MNMTDYKDISQRLSTLEFLGYSKVITELLSAYDIVQTTIDRIASKINDGEPGPFYVYRRAAIYCTEDEDFENKISSLRTALPLVIVLQPTKIIVFNSEKGKIECKYNNLVEYLDFLSPLHNWDINRNDHYSTIELDTLVESLYRELKLNDNDEINIRSFIFSLLYIAHFKSLLKIDQINNQLREYTSANEVKLSEVFNFFLDQKCPFVVDNTPCLVISKEAYQYIFAIIRFDTNLIDAEILTSLIYRMTDREKSGLYGHQTSFINVEKLLQPLFLNQMQSKAVVSTNENVFGIVTDIYETIVFDPTNGPGSFLVSAYNGLTQQLRDIENRFNISCKRPLNLSHFVGLVDNDLTKDLTRLALTFTHTQELSRLNLLNMSVINDIYDELNINVGNELTDDWRNFVEPNEHLYIVGSPEFKGGNKVPAKIKEDMQTVFDAEILYNADLSSTWLIKSASLIRGTKAKAGFVLTNIVSQGTQATFILNKINELGCEYSFAHRSFKWKTSSVDNSGVTVVIIGIASKDDSQIKYIYDGGNRIPCKVIGASLLPNIDIRIMPRKQPLSHLLPHMRKGNMPDGATPLTFTSSELDDFLAQYPEAKKYIKTLYGGDEFVSGFPKWVLWITDEELPEAMKIDGVAKRIEMVRQKRNAPKSTSSKKSRNNPHKFRETNCTSKGKISIIIPCVTSENREYFQIGILDSNSIVNNNVSVIFDCDIWLLALLESRMHMVWAKNACGGHETRPRYSSEICYNTFPLPELTNKQINILRNLSKTLLEVRESYCNKSLGELYLHMPPELKRVHHWIDETVDSFYRNQPFETDAERLIWMKNLYNRYFENE